MRISDWSSDVCSSDLAGVVPAETPAGKHYSSMGLTVEHPLDLVRIPIGEFGHHTGYVYDFETLKAELEAAGFRDVVRCPLGEKIGRASCRERVCPYV